MLRCALVKTTRSTTLHQLTEPRSICLVRCVLTRKRRRYVTTLNNDSNPVGRPWCPAPDLHLDHLLRLFQGLPDGPNSNSGYQVIFSLSARTKISGTTVPPYGYQDDPTFQTHVVWAFQSYFTSSGFSPKLMQIKNLDNSQAGVGLFVRLFAANGMLLSIALRDCSYAASLTLASSMYHPS